VATAAAVAASSVARTANVTTVVTATAHGLVAGQGFALSGVSNATFNGNGTIATVPTTTSFTFAQTGANVATSALGGSVLPARQIIILEVADGDPGQLRIRYALWLTTATPVVQPSTTTSVWSGVSAAENAAIVAGTTVEKVKTDQFPKTFAKVDIQAFLAKDYAAEQQQLASTTQPGTFFGVFFDGTGWSA
jgi:hypothetical protein